MIEQIGSAPKGRGLWQLARFFARCGPVGHLGTERLVPQCNDAPLNGAVDWLCSNDPIRVRDDDHTTTRTRTVSATPTSSDAASATAKTRRSKGVLLDADPGSRSNAD
jgi:hypothetical protein